MNISKIRLLITISLLITATIIVLPIFFLSEKECHLSFDDVSKCMKELTLHRDRYSSIFEEPFLRELKRLHDITGAKFTLYLYERDGGYDIADFPDRFAKEFDKNGSWLKVGYHSKSLDSTLDSIADYKTFVISFNKVDSVLTTKFRSARTHILRLHMYYATTREISHLRSMGITTLLCADDNRISYDLKKKENVLLSQKEYFIKNSMTYITTDLRIERDNAIIGLVTNSTDDYFVIFTHEWAYHGMVRLKFNFLVFYLFIYNCIFTN
ncbi:MAG: hypothetical protein IJ606_03415 [Bacteroidaceae bacterium]|nr:hypothetical protein [Bacteroidaceae bacterium]